MNCVYVVKAQSDMTEGRGSMQIKAIFSNEDAAWEYANKQTGVMGRRPDNCDWRSTQFGKDWDVISAPVYSSCDECEFADNRIIRDRAMAKLTEQERKVLGLQ